MHPEPDTAGHRFAAFRQKCGELGLSATHQRQVIYDALLSMHDHPSPEAVYERVRPLIPAISLATVYKTIHTFVEKGLLREVSLHHGSLRIEANLSPHHHLVCVKCRAIQDLEDHALEPVRLRDAAPGGFAVHRYSVDVLGLCPACANHGEA